MSASTGPARGSVSFRRIVDVPFQTCAAALDPLQRTGQDGELRFGGSLLRGPVEHDRGAGTHRIQVRLARGPLRPPLRMRLDIDRWSATSTAIELIPAGASGPPRPTSAPATSCSTPSPAPCRSACPGECPRHRKPATPARRFRAPLIPATCGPRPRALSAPLQ
jgi:hypothetical protein